jgi:ribosomal protein S18 acetylase RimI-like enzyme
LICAAFGAPAILPNERSFDLTIRAAEMNDAAVLAQLMRELGYETSTAEMQPRLQSILSDTRFRTFVAEVDNRICGMIGTLTHASHEHNDPSGKIMVLVVSKKQRRSGIGRALVAAAEKDFAKHGITRLSLTTRFSREEAHQFYESLGYTRTGIRFAKDLQTVEARK